MNKKGFTLIELMIVVVIIGILAAIAIPNFISMQDRAKEGSVKSNMHTVQLAVEDYAVKQVGNYAADSDLTLLAVDVSNPFNSSAAGLVANVATIAGDVGYDHDNYGSLSYSITGFGKEAILQDADGNIFTLTNEN
ncbi:MAG: hypothetical protein B6244_00985 [Candidatus Cloacimonetes bacterium 4572_55]|nr:MAG: hypothetical protein B6244_00985 [Candidatus Cloacimonetes bacterium 4572_55]